MKLVSLALLLMFSANGMAKPIRQAPEVQLNDPAARCYNEAWTTLDPEVYGSPYWLNIGAIELCAGTSRDRAMCYREARLVVAQRTQASANEVDRFVMMICTGRIERGFLRHRQ